MAHWHVSEIFKDRCITTCMKEQRCDVLCHCIINREIVSAVLLLGYLVDCPQLGFKKLTEQAPSERCRLLLELVLQTLVVYESSPFENRCCIDFIIVRARLRVRASAATLTIARSKTCEQQF
jgi:hypothetical protein